MKNRRQKCIAIKALLLLALLGAGSMAWAAQVVGTIVHLSGPLLARKADGTVKILAQKSEVEQGDTLVTEKNTYAQVKFIDNGEITLRPGTTFTIDQFAYDAGQPDGDAAAFSLLKGGLRSITGLLGKRNHEKFLLKTPSATIGIRGTTFIAQYVPPPAPGVPPSTGGVLSPGLHVQVTDGMIVLTNSGGSQNFSAGQFGFVPSLVQPPVLVPPNPGMQFTPPPAFTTSQGSVTGTAAAGPATGATDCIVR
jgi:hypothetical protein